MTPLLHPFKTSDIQICIIRGLNHEQQGVPERLTSKIARHSNKGYKRNMVERQTCADKKKAAQKGGFLNIIMIDY